MIYKMPFVIIGHLWVSSLTYCIQCCLYPTLMIWLWVVWFNDKMIISMLVDATWYSYMNSWNTIGLPNTSNSQKCRSAVLCTDAELVCIPFVTVRWRGPSECLLGGWNDCEVSLQCIQAITSPFTLTTVWNGNFLEDRQRSAISFFFFFSTSNPASGNLHMYWSVNGMI